MNHFLPKTCRYRQIGNVVFGYGKEPIKSSAIGSWGAKLKEQGRSMPKPSGHDFLSILRCKVSAKKRRERMKAIENF